jgi:DNA ligase (NAD+)
MDGLVIKTLELDQEDLAKSRPDKQIAFKFVCEEATSPIIEVEWSTSGNKYTPIGKITPVSLNGTTVKQANLCNLRMINDMGVKIGSVVVMTKRGEIIPKIERVISTPDNATPISHPTTCECCGSKLQFTDNLTLLYCPNPNCVKVLKHKLWKWVCMMEIMDIGGKFIDKIVDDGLVKSITDFYNLTEDQIANIDRMGVRSAKKIIKNRDVKLETTISKFIVGFDIDGIGTTTIDKIIEVGYDTLGKILNITRDDLLKINGFGEATVKALIEGIELNRSEMENLSYNKIKLITVTKNTYGYYISITMERG